jgi:hypothetical protein
MRDEKEKRDSPKDATADSPRPGIVVASPGAGPRLLGDVLAGATRR